MQAGKRLSEEIDFVETLRSLAQAYEEISVIRMQRVRGSVLKLRDFLEGLSKIFADVKSSYKRQIMALMRKKKIKNVTSFSTLVRNGKEVIVLLSANSKLYGDIIPRVSRAFIESVQNSQCDIVIVGKLGKDLFEQQELKKPYTYFEIPDSDVTFVDLKPLISRILEYEKVIVYYGRFENIVNQSPVSSIISGQEVSEGEISEEAGKLRFLFEPSLERILNFFETQMFASFFNQTVHESQLARYASRVKAMEVALENIDGKIKTLERQKTRLKNDFLNKKQLETIAGITLWQRR